MGYGTIYVSSLSEHVANEISCLKYSDQQVIDMHASLNKAVSTKKTTLIVVMSIVSIVFLANGIVIFSKTMPTATFIGYMIGLVLIVFFIGFVSWYCAIGKLTMKWNKLMKTFYPQLADRCKL